MTGPTELKVEVSYAQLNKSGEELCGDTVEVIHGPPTIVVLSDGLGSGVKAHILSSLTAKMVATMLSGGLGLAEVIDAVAKTLPVCEVRHLAYSTFSILRIGPDNVAYLVEYDNPLAIVGRGSQLLPLERTRRAYGDREVWECEFQVQDGDWIVMVSDGVLHAGIGGIWNLGWGWERVRDFLSRTAPYQDDSRGIAGAVVETTRKLYAGRPGDDATAVAVKIRKRRYLTILAGPPVNPADDSKVVRMFMESPGKKAVCGGTTSIMVARELGRPLEVNLGSLRSNAPPTGRIEGIDLVTEGILTLSRVAELLQEGPPPRRNIAYRSDGPSQLASLLLEADDIRFLVGRAINPAHQSPDLPATLALKQKVVEDLCRVLYNMGKRVIVETF